MKYEILNESRIVDGRKVYRIRSLKDFANVSKGDLGGWVERETNLSQQGDCWIYGEAVSMENAVVENNAKLMDSAIAYGDAMVLDNAVLADRSKIYEVARIYDKAKMLGDSRAYGKAEIFGHSKLLDMSRAFRNAWVSHDTVLRSVSSVTEKTSRDPFCVTNNHYNITIMDNHISFDCETRTTQEWYDMSERELIEIDGAKAVKFHKRFKDGILKLAQEHQNNFTNM